MNSGGKGKVQGHQENSAMNKAAFNVDNKYSVKKHQALGIFPNNGWNFEKYQPSSYHDWQNPELK